MATSPEHNPYPGINAHLNSLLQEEPGGWESFHSEHIIDLVRGIDAVLPAGYIAHADKSLQISEIMDEIDYLHETRPIIPVLKSYPQHEGDAYPYTVLVTDPRPTLEHGYTFTYGVGVDDKLPVVTIPLAGVDTVIVDLTDIYNTTFTGIAFYSLAVDYAQPPVNFERYTEADQQRILRRMKMIQEFYDI